MPDDMNPYASYDTEDAEGFDTEELPPEGEEEDW